MYLQEQGRAQWSAPGGWWIRLEHGVPWSSCQSDRDAERLTGCGSVDVTLDDLMRTRFPRMQRSQGSGCLRHSVPVFLCQMMSVQTAVPTALFSLSLGPGTVLSPSTHSVHYYSFLVPETAVEKPSVGPSAWKSHLYPSDLCSSGEHSQRESCKH